MGNSHEQLGMGQNEMMSISPDTFPDVRERVTAGSWQDERYLDRLMGEVEYLGMVAAGSEITYCPDGLNFEQLTATGLARMASVQEGMRVTPTIMVDCRSDSGDERELVFRVRDLYAERRHFMYWNLRGKFAIGPADAAAMRSLLSMKRGKTIVSHYKSDITSWPGWDHESLLRD